MQPVFQMVAAVATGSLLWAFEQATLPVAMSTDLPEHCFMRGGAAQPAGIVLQIDRSGEVIGAAFHGGQTAALRTYNGRTDGAALKLTETAGRPESPVSQDVSWRLDAAGLKTQDGVYAPADCAEVWRDYLKVLDATA